MKRRLFLNIIIRERTTILQLLSGKDQTLLVGRDALFVLDLGFDIVDCVRRFDFESYGFAGESLDEDLHAATEPVPRMSVVSWKRRIRGDI